MLSNILVQILIGLSFVVLQGNCATRIIGGDNATIDKFPYLVSIFADGHLCGGALLRPDVVLSAAHCFNKNKNQTNMYVFGGSSEYYIGKNTTIQLIERQTKYNFVAHDIVLLKLTTPLVGKSIKPIALPEKEPPYNVFMTAAGWGVTENGKNSDLLKTTNLMSISRKVCIEKYRGWPAIGTFCALGKGTDTCRGDSGTPLVYQGKVYGVTAAGSGCAQKNTPGEYTDVYYYIDWIKDVLKQFETTK